jgi:hypothetical protein
MQTNKQTPICKNKRSENMFFRAVLHVGIHVSKCLVCKVIPICNSPYAKKYFSKTLKLTFCSPFANGQCVHHMVINMVLVANRPKSPGPACPTRWDGSPTIRLCGRPPHPLFVRSRS